MPSGVDAVMRVATSSSVIGIRRHCRPHAAAISAVTSESGAPARSRSRAVQMGGEVAVADVEPRGHPVALERAEGRERLADEAPSGLGVVGARERVGDRVEVGADPEPVEPVVVAGVADDDDVGRVDHLEQPRQEASGADSTCQGHDHAQQGSGDRSTTAFVTRFTNRMAVP